MKRMVVDTIVEMDAKRRRIEGHRPTRMLSYTSKSCAFSAALNENRIARGVDFFFDLYDTTTKPFHCTAFADNGPECSSDENKFHHVYFIKQLNILVEAAKRAGITLKQHVYWSKSGRWMTLDDKVGATGVEPDFCMTATRADESWPPVPKDGEKVKPPQSKYDVTVAMEMKKKFTEKDQIEALDYGERLLCIQRGRKSAYSALLHCCKKDKVIRWLKIEETSDGKFSTKISRPASLAPSGEGQKQLLTILTKSSEELGLDFPTIKSSETNDLVQITSLIGEGATSTVYAANFRGQQGVLKLLKPGFENRADHEYNILKHELEKENLKGIPSAVTMICNGALFFAEELTYVNILNSEQCTELIDILKNAHSAGVVHRDVRPDNIMQSLNGQVFLIDWGFAYRLSEQSIPPFEGTFRYASDDVLDSAIISSERAPQPKDDLHSLARIILSQNSTCLKGELAELTPANLKAAKDLWQRKRDSYPSHEWLFDAAERCQYDKMKEGIFGGRR